MTEETFVSITERLKTIWKKDFLDNEVEMEVWYRLLSDIPDNVAIAAANTYMATKVYPPKPADIREIAVSITQKETGELTSAEAFSLYWKAVSNGIYGAQKEYDALPEIVQRASGGVGAIQAAAMDENTNYDVEKALFEKRFNTIKSQMTEEAKIPESVKIAINGILQQRLEEKHEIT